MNIRIEELNPLFMSWPHSYQTDEFGTVSKTQITKICEDKFSAKKGHDGKQRCLIFNKDMLVRLKDNYSAIDKIEIIYRNNSSQFSDTNTFNTFNTFWNSLENIRAGEKRSRSNNSNENSFSSHNTNEKPHKDNSEPNEVSARHPEKVLEPLKVLESQESKKIKDNTMAKKSDYILYFDSKKENSENDKTQVRNDYEIGHKEPFYFCKKHPIIQNIHREEIVRHIQLSYLHKKSDEIKLTKESRLEDGQK